MGIIKKERSDNIGALKIYVFTERVKAYEIWLINVVDDGGSGEKGSNDNDC